MKGEREEVLDFTGGHEEKDQERRNQAARSLESLQSMSDTSVVPPQEIMKLRLF